MSDKTAAELVSDFVKTQIEMRNTDIFEHTEYYFTLRKSNENIVQEMREWHEEMNQKINKT